MEYQQLFEHTRQAGNKLALIDKDKIDAVLNSFAGELVRESSFLLRENEKDLQRMHPDDPKYDRLKLTEGSIAAIAADIRNVASLASPVGTTLMHRTLPNQLQISKVVVPIGVIGIIYEARPNVTCDAFVLCFKTGNACVLKGGSDAQYSNIALINVIKSVLAQQELDTDTVNLLPADRQSAHVLLQASGYVDVIIPRGSQQLINYVREQARIPVIETGAGIVHTFLDESADVGKATDIICNAKTRRVSVCNALDCLIIHEKRLAALPEIAAPLAKKSVSIYADAPSYQVLAGNYPADLLFRASAEHFGTEFLSLRMAVKTVGSLEAALEHISRYGSKHSEAILSTDEGNINRFLQQVDAAAVYANTSTAFTDGAQFGLGAEIGISTQKLHARGPMGLEALTSYKWIVRGDGQVRNG